MRLIDADALLEKKYINEGKNTVGVRKWIEFSEIEDAPTVSPWHRVEDGLPKQGEWVLVKSCLVQMSTDFIDKTWRWYRTPGVTHWMPLPEPPKEDA